MEFHVFLTALLGATTLAAGWLYLREKQSKALLQKDVETLQHNAATYQQDLQELEQQNATLRDKLHEAEKQAALKEQQLKDAQERREEERKTLTTHFENMANKIFEAKQKTFSEQSQKGLQEVLNPLKERFMEFQKKVDESFGTHAKEQFHLKEEIKRIVSVNEKMTLQAESLTKALKGDVKAQGNWGEVMLEKILESSGLRKELDYTVQGTFRHPEDGRMLRPDVIVKLPEDKHIIIDSKLSLTHYERYTAEEDETLRAAHLKQFIQSIRTHVDGLAQKGYQDTQALGTPDFVLMFLPIEGGYSLAIQTDRELHSYAWNKRIVMVSPSTLFPILRTIASIWRLELQNRNAQEIARQGGGLYDKIAGFIKDMQMMGKQLGTVNKTYDGAMNKLSEGKGSILSRTENLRELGAKTSKQIDNKLLETDEAPREEEEVA